MIFGMIEGVPIIEIFLTTLLLILAGLIVMIIELRKMRRVIKTEEADFRRFETDMKIPPVGVPIDEHKPEEKREKLLSVDREEERPIGLATKRSRESIMEAFEEKTSETPSERPSPDNSDEPFGADSSEKTGAIELTEAEKSAIMYIKSALEKGYSKDVVKQKLVAHGWDPILVDNLISKVQ